MSGQASWADFLVGSWAPPDTETLLLVGPWDFPATSRSKQMWDFLRVAVTIEFSSGKKNEAIHLNNNNKGNAQDSNRCRMELGSKAPRCRSGWTGFVWAGDQTLARTRATPFSQWTEASNEWTLVFLWGKISTSNPFFKQSPRNKLLGKLFAWMEEISGWSRNS